MKLLTFRFLWRVITGMVILLPLRLSAQGIPYASFKVEYPTLSGRLAITGVRTGKDENFIRLIDVNNPVSEDISYIQCRDPVFFGQPVLIGKNQSLWQFYPNVDSLSIFIHKDGNLVQKRFSFPASVTLEKTEILADEEINYLAVFLKHQDKLQSISFIFVDDTNLCVSEWTMFQDCAMCSKVDRSMSIRWIKLTSHKLGPVVAWCDFKEPPKFQTIAVFVSQLVKGSWTTPVVLDSENSDKSPDVCADGNDIIATWHNGSHTINAARVNSENGVKGKWEVTNLLEETGENAFFEEARPVILNGTLYVFYSYYRFTSDERHTAVRRFTEDNWKFFGEIVHAKQLMTYFPFISDGEVSVIFSVPEEIYMKTLKGSGWVKSDKMEQSQCYLKTLNRCVTISDFVMDTR